MVRPIRPNIIIHRCSTLFYMEPIYMVIKNITGNVLKATIFTGKFKGEIVLFPRILMTPSGSPIQYKILQFTIALDFAMTIKKVQGQTMTIYELDYVTCSSVGK